MEIKHVFVITVEAVAGIFKACGLQVLINLNVNNFGTERMVATC